MRYQPPALVKKRRIKRSCSERELLVLIRSMATSEDEGETLHHPRDCRNRWGESSTKIVSRIPARSGNVAIFRKRKAGQVQYWLDGIFGDQCEVVFVRASSGTLASADGGRGSSVLTAAQ